MTRPLLRAALALCATLSTTAVTRATVLVGADLGELSRDAVAIARGRIAAVTPRVTADRLAIETIVTLEVEEYLKGSLGGTIDFRVPGGEVGRFRRVVVGAPQFARDERVIVFLGARGPSIPYVLGLSQGLFRVVDSVGSEALVTPPPVLPTLAGGAVAVVRGDPARRRMPLTEFEARVRALAGGAK